MLELRPATAADYVYAKQIHHAAYRDMVTAQFGVWDESVQDRFFDKSWHEAAYDIILIDGEPCGYCRIDEHDKVLQLVECAMEVSRQNQGIGSMLLTRFKEMAGAKGKIAQMNVMKTNVRAKALYEKLGFAVYGENQFQFMMRQLDAHLLAAAASVRLKAALAIGANPDPDLIDTLLAQCAIEPDFYVRDMLTWALTRFPSAVVVPRLLGELRSPVAQARSQALHTLSKIRDGSTWPAITPFLRDPDDEVARSAWRAAVILVPEAERKSLAQELASQFGRGNRPMQLSLSRALVELGEEAIAPVLQQAMASDVPAVRAHASATERLLRDPNGAFEPDLNEAKRAFVLSRER